MNNQSEKEDDRLVLKRLADAKMRLLVNSPFYGNLVVHLNFTLGKCGTAATDMRQVIFDPEFIMRLPDSEVDFVLKHEILHCVLQHCRRAGNKKRYLYNIACDIVVNSNILHTMGRKTFSVDHVEVIHLTPGDEEGYLYSAEEVYNMLISKYEKLILDVEEVLKTIEDDYGILIDSHDIWECVPLEDSLSEEWRTHLLEAAKAAGKSEVLPPVIRELLEDYKQKSKLNWKAVLNDFIRKINDTFDYSYMPPDRRFSDVILPSFHEINNDSVDNLWFVVDTSGSVSNENLTRVYTEISAAIEQFDYLDGKISFFDTKVSEPKEFDSVEKLKKMKAVGGGGTSFHCIFRYMKEHMTEKLPTAIIILTDGLAVFPDESATLGVPVLWIIVGNKEAVAPFGITIQI